MCEKKIVKAHFNYVSSTYDKNNTKPYWKLSDDLLWEIIKCSIDKMIEKNNRQNFRFLELGTGTGQWACKILSFYKSATCVLVDFSEDMLKEARENLAVFNNRIEIINSDIDQFKYSEKFDLVLNIYVLPFYSNESKMVSIIANYLNNGGISIIATENYYNGLAINILKGNENDIFNMVNKNEGYLSEIVPKMHFSKMTELSKCLESNKITPILKCGFPVLSLIGVKEYLSNENKSLSNILSKNYDLIFNLEKDYIFDENLVNRGKYICIVGEKNEKNINIERNY